MSTEPVETDGDEIALERTPLIGSIEDMNTRDRVARMMVISAKLLEVLQLHSGRVEYDRAVRAVSNALAITPSQVQYGVVYAESSGKVRSDDSGSFLTAA